MCGTISVIICTYNRADCLSRAISSVAGQLRQDDEILVIDNGSTDDTREVARHFEDKGPLRYLFEAQPGLCHARNTGWRNATGEIIAYLDDDAVASGGWLAAIREAFSTTPPPGIVGGKIDPIWQGERPEWLSDQIAPALTIVNWSEQPKTISDLRSEWLAGANMAVRVGVLAEVGGFDLRLDRVEGNMLSNGDLYLQEQIMKRGYTCLYYPTMAVGHLVPVSRLNKAWFRRRYYWQGISDAVIYDIRFSPAAWRRWLYAVIHTTHLLAMPKRLIGLMFSSDDPKRFTDTCFALARLGYIAGLVRR